MFYPFLAHYKVNTHRFSQKSSGQFYPNLTGQSTHPGILWPKSLLLAALNFYVAHCKGHMCPLAQMSGFGNDLRMHAILWLFFSVPCFGGAWTWSSTWWEVACQSLRMTLWVGAHLSSIFGIFFLSWFLLVKQSQAHIFLQFIIAVFTM